MGAAPESVAAAKAAVAEARDGADANANAPGQQR